MCELGRRKVVRSDSNLFSPVEDAKVAEQWEGVGASLKALEDSQKILSMLHQYLCQACDAFLTDNLKLLHVRHVPKLEISFEDFGEMIGLLVQTVSREDVEIVVLVASSLSLLERLVDDHFGQHVVVNDLVRSHWNESGQVRLEHTLCVVLVNYESALFAGLGYEGGRPEYVVFGELVLIAAVRVGFVWVEYAILCLLLIR